MKKIVVLFFFLFINQRLNAQENFVDVVENVTQSVGAIALVTPIESNAPQILGTGFVIEDGTWAITNYHVVNKPLDPTIVQYYAFLSGEGQVVNQVKATVEKVDPLHDLALLKLSKKLPPLRLADDNIRPPGTEIAMTGFPIGAVLGLYPATHRGFIAAVTPDAIPVKNADQLSLAMLKRMGKSQLIYQLDMTAYPGNSGSPIYDISNGEVIGILNKVIVRDTKESALSNPTGISYSVPVKGLYKLISKK